MKSAGKIRTVLVANRGEIARRICRTLKKLQLRSVAVYSDADANSPVLHEADDAVWIGESESKESYLNIQSIIDAAKSAGADAIHPGYGFLSENPDFATACAKAGIIFIGPSPEAISTVADKRQAKEIARKLNVPTTASLELSSLTTESLSTFAKENGLPLLIKAAFGGGGRGMRIVKSLDELESLKGSASDEAAKFFSSSEVFIETYIDAARHIEVQIVGSHNGEVIAFGTRDCSWQRNYQKVIEEAPAANLAPGIEEALIKAAIAIGKSVKYVGAGTVEFLVKDNKFYFLEVNSRIQVEHPVTEMIYGIDLVEAQIRIAKGESFKNIFPTPPKQSGHAIEARICAENVRKAFAPQTGYCSKIVFPESEEGSHQNRFDFAFDTQGEISHFYDSMIGKVITWAPTKSQAIESLMQTLRELKVIGIITNTEFLLTLLADSRFANSTVTTNSLKTLPPASTSSINDKALLVGALIWSDVPRQTAGSTSFRLHGAAIQNITGIFNGTEINVSIKWEYSGGSITKAIIDGSYFEYDRSQNDFFINQSKVSFYRQGPAIFAFSPDGSFCVELPQPKPVLDQEDQSTIRELKSSIPGKILHVVVQPNQSVAIGDVLVVIESMKMEHQIRSPRTGVIDSILIRPSEVVAKLSPLVTFKS